MVRVRLVTTPIWSQPHLVAALAQVGFPDVETHAGGAALESWRGTPLGVDAHLIVRRKHMGAATDDFGFARNARGTFDLVMSEVHFFRFDRRWMEDLARRHDGLARAAGMTPPSNLPGWEKRDLGEPTPRSANEPPPRPGRGDAAVAAQQAQRARAETAATLDGLRKRRKKGGAGCAASLIAPLILWTVLAGLEPGLRGAPGFFSIVIPLWFALAVWFSIRATRRTAQAARDLLARLPSSDTARAAAEEYLESRLKPAGAKAEDALAKELLRALKEPRT